MTKKTYLWLKAELEHELFLVDDELCQRLIESHLILYEAYEALKNETTKTKKAP
jgi:hypothetical protein